MSSMTPREIVQELDKHIVGQAAAKRAVAIALRNRWRRMQVGEELRGEITPKNILMIGPTGVGKTEIARRLARLANAPFIKVEATKFTEVGYVGREVDSIVKDLIDVAVKMTREQEVAKVRHRAMDAAEERVLDVLLPKPRAMPDEPDTARDGDTRQRFRKMLREGQLDDREIDVEVRAVPVGVEIMAPPGHGGTVAAVAGHVLEPGRQPHQDPAAACPRGLQAADRGRSRRGWSTRKNSRSRRCATPSRTASCSSTRSTRSRAARKPPG